MSGGHFDYKQYRINEIVDSIIQAIEDNVLDEHDEYDWRGWEFNDNTIAEFERAVLVLKMAEIYAQRIDWLLSGDDGEECFHKRLEKELAELDDFKL